MRIADVRSSFRLPPSSLMLAALLAACVSAQSFAQTAGYPNRPIRLIVPFTAGSATDILARLVGPKLNESWGQQVVVDNRPSAGGTVAGIIVAGAAPDGHTLLMTSSAFAVSAALYARKLPYDPLKDFAGITQIASTPLIVVVAPGLGPKSVKELIALAREKPGQVNFGSSGIGSGTHYASELFRLAAHIDVVHVPYKGTPEVLNDVIAGRIQYFIAPVLPSLPLVKSGRLLGLAVTTRDRMAVMPDVPTVAEAALPGYEYDGWFGILAPGKTSRTVINALSREIGRILRLPDVKERIEGQGAVPRPTSPQEFDKYVRSEIVIREKVFKGAGTRVE